MYWHSKKIALILGIISAALAGCVTMFPPKAFTTNIRTLNQGWDEKDRALFYRTSQGTFSIPLNWMMALEQPGFGEQPLLMEPDYISGLGFMFAGEVDSGKAKGLPIGFAVTADPKTGQDFVGFTCAACHTGQINYTDPNDGQLKAFRVDGGASLHALDKYRLVLVASIIKTHKNPARFDRFAKRILGENASEEARNKLQEALRNAVKTGLKNGLTEAFEHTYPVEEGYGRLDALQRISNTVFGYDLENMDNLRPGSGPVSYPHVWDIWRLDWVQWNGSVRQPMARNVGEALGVFAKLNLTEKDKLFESTVPVRNLYAIEETLKKLHPPQWPEDVWPLDQQKVAQGKELFEKHCVSCHGVKVIKGTQEWRVTMLPYTTIGTDRTTAENFINYRVDASAIGGPKEADQAFGLQFMTEKVMKDRYKREGVTAAEKPLLDGFGRTNVVRAPCGYKARPLHGVWATAPFLHNGSVPNLYELLSPQDERSTRFDVGSYMFDPVKVGYVTRVPNGTVYDTTKQGSSNLGHMFDNVTGSIGPRLTEEERYAIIEFIKSYQLEDLPSKNVSRPTSYPCDDTTPIYGN